MERMKMFNSVPDDVLLRIFALLSKPELCRVARVCRRWNELTFDPSLWHRFSLGFERPKWLSYRLIPSPCCDFLIQHRFSLVITYVDLSKMNISLDGLDVLFRHCPSIEALCINFKYLEFQVHTNETVRNLPKRLRKLYLKNVCDRKFRPNFPFQMARFDLIEVELMDFVKRIIAQNSSTLTVLGLKCVEPDLISQCVEYLEHIEVLLLNNIVDTDAVLEELADHCENLRSLEITKCREFNGDGLVNIVEGCPHFQCLSFGKQTEPMAVEFEEFNWVPTSLRELQLYTKSIPNQDSRNGSMKGFDWIAVYDSMLSSLRSLEYLCINEVDVEILKRMCEYRVGLCLRRLCLRAQGRTALIPEHLRNFLQLAPPLYVLDLAGVLFDVDELVTSLRHLPSLRVLRIGHGRGDVKPRPVHLDSLMESLSLNCRHIERIDLLFCPSEVHFKIDEKGLSPSLILLFQACRYLQSLGILCQYACIQASSHAKQHEPISFLELATRCLRCCSNPRVVIKHYWPFGAVVDRRNWNVERIPPAEAPDLDFHLNFHVKA